MTAEIAVLNRLGVALAADSAVTISGGGSSKVFNSADKLFELSERFPVAVMINDNMDCFGVPWEIIIKDFRRKHGNASKKSIKLWAEAFLSFVEERSDIKSGAGLRFAISVLFEEIAILKDTVMERLWEKKDPVKGKNVIEQLMSVISSERTEELKLIKPIERLKNIDVKSFISSQIERFSKIIKDEILPIEASQILVDSIIENLSIALISGIESGHSTGIIFAGYGSDDTYPSVYSVDVSGYVCGKLKYSDFSARTVANGLDAGHVVSFAQTDVSERLLEGADPNFVIKTTSFLSSAADTIAPMIVDAIAPGRSRSRPKLIKQVRDILGAIDAAYKDTAANDMRKEFRDEFERMIAMMPKMELIEFAEALINITAIERKATPDQGTVGGPIDVAFITKHEGFVWIKRKHYFDPHLNPRYFWRKYPTKIGRDENDSPHPTEAN